MVKILDSIFYKDLPINYKLRDILIEYPGGSISKDLADYILQTYQYNDSVSIQIYDPLILDLNGNGKIDLTSGSIGSNYRNVFWTWRDTQRKPYKILKKLNKETYRIIINIKSA